MTEANQAGMRVETPRMLSVLAHEVRGPLGVIQGYIRLLMRGREETHPDAPLLRAMMDATGKLSSVCRQASELGKWLGPTDEVSSSDVTLRELMDLIRSRVPQDKVSVATITDPTRIRTLNAEMLAGAVGAVADATLRELGDVPIAIAVAASEDPDVCVLTVSAPGHDLDYDSTTPFNFDRGGHGLSLVLASYVFDAHKARVAAAGSAGAATIRLQKVRGTE